MKIRITSPRPLLRLNLSKTKLRKEGNRKIDFSHSCDRDGNSFLTPVIVTYSAIMMLYYDVVPIGLCNRSVRVCALPVLQLVQLSLDVVFLFVAGGDCSCSEFSNNTARTGVATSSTRPILENHIRNSTNCIRQGQQCTTNGWDRVDADLTRKAPEILITQPQEFRPNATRLKIPYRKTIY